MIDRIRAKLEPRLPEAMQLSLHRGDEKRRDKKFLANIDEQSRLKKKLHDCGQLEDYLEFARSEFDLNQKPSEIRFLIELLADRRPKIIGEIGSFRCGNLFLLNFTVDSVDKIIAVDRVFRQKAMYAFLVGDRPETQFIQGNSQFKSTVSNVKRRLNGSLFDFLFIDGDHTYEGVKADFLAYRELVKEGGLIGFHDIVPDLTTRMKSEVPLSKCFAGGVPIFWSEVKDKYESHEFIEDVDQDGFGIGVIEYWPRNSSVNPGNLGIPF